ncbi:RHS repeat-associated protein [Chryseobacterium sp. H1D6B]|uniref:SpvB/TcaC N-terminal domain-containing protein n=1 Tax=Chryseobacterium sp. H1D6B TaxID=2940588 RepID=UPI0015CAB10F|nr:SpvB/TcaC N-terminal domain-containing protein [Chryseobacterium sp. H1D6B]MDH6252850.1 RHS repeat-associated protein [Chryseobacterium sp. H1D6B]
MKIKSKQLPFTKKSCLVVFFFACMFVSAGFTKEDRQRVREFKKDLMSRLIPEKAVPLDDNSEETPSSDKSSVKNDKVFPLGSNASASDISGINPKTINGAPADNRSASENSSAYLSKEKEGTIGTFSDKEEDNISDNFFTVDVPSVDKNAVAYLEYDLFGLSSHESVPRSINHNIAVGGEIVVPNASWSRQREAISTDLIRNGVNTILFTSPAAGVKYKIKNLKIVFDKDKKPSGDLIISSLLSGDKLYVKGNNIISTGLSINNENVFIKNGEFEKLIHLSEKDKSKGRFSITADGIINSYKIPNTTASFKVLSSNNYSAKSIEISKGQELSLNYEGVNIKIEKETSESAYLEVFKLRTKDFPGTSQGLKNITADNAAYRLSVLSGKLNKKVKLAIPYDEKRLGMVSPKDIKVFYFDYTKKQWKIDASAVLDEKSKTLVVESSGEGDYINGVISVPESPQTAAMSPTSLNGLKAGNPTSRVQFIAPPTASQNGDASTSYPIIIPEGRLGMQPSLSIAYSSGNGNGWMGEGWDISGLSSINVDPRWGSPAFEPDTETELYSLDGEMLVYPGNYLPHRHNNLNENTDVFDTNKQLRTANKKVFFLRRNHNFTKIERYGATPSQYTWVVTATNGMKSYYGGTESAVAPGAVIKKSDGNIVKWALVKTMDNHGNYIEYIYDNTIVSNQSGDNTNLNDGQVFHISKINYTRRGGRSSGTAKFYTVEFERETSITRKDISMNAKLGTKIIEPYKLKNINVKYNNTLIRTYVLNYKEGEFYKTLLSGIQEFDKNYQPGNMSSLTNQYDLEYYNDVEDEKEKTKTLFSGDVDIAGTGSYSDAFPLLPNFLMPSKIGATNTFEWGVNGRLPGVGLNFLFPSNNAYGHIMAAFSLGLSNAEAKKAQELMDFNGDGISDIIYRRPSSGLYFKPGVLSANGNLTWGPEKSINYLNSNFSLTKTKTDHLGYDAGINIFGIGFNFSQMWSTSKSETSSFIVDANSDGLMDVVKDGEVLFSKINDAGNAEMSRYSENTENMVIVADTVKPNDPPLDGWNTISKNDVVKVWIAPKSGNIKITDRVKMENVPNAKAVYSVEMKNPLDPAKNGRVYIKEIIAGPSENISITNYDNYYSQIQGLTPQNQDHLAINSSNKLYVEAGDKVYIRLHKNDSYSYQVISNPDIMYVTGKFSQNTEIYEQDGFYVNNGAYSENFFLNNHTKPIQIDKPGTLNISVPQVVFPRTTDDIRFKVVKVNLNNDVETPLFTSPVYPQNDNGITVPSIQLNGLTVSQSEIPSIIKFVVETDSHTDFKNYNWNKIDVDFTASAGGGPTHYNGVADYPSTYIAEFNQKFSVGNLAFTVSFPAGVQTYKIEINKNLPSTAGLTNGTFYYIIKKAGHVLGKRRIIITGNGANVTELDMTNNQPILGNSPIPFYTGDMTGGGGILIPTDEMINIQVYCRTKEDYDLYKAYSTALQGPAFNIYYAQGNTYLGRTGHTSINSSSLENVGQFYKNWSQFLYNEYADVVPVSTPDGFGLNPNTPADNYGRLINPEKVQPIAVPVSLSYPACDNLPTAQATAECIVQQINNSGYYQNPANFTPSPIKPLEVYVAKSGRVEGQEQTITEKWIGVGPQQYAMASYFKDDETVSGFFDPFVANPDLPDNLILQGNVDTKMYGINKKYYSKSRTNTLSGSLFGVGLQNANSNLVGKGSICLQDYFDMNGDGYPDIVYSNAMQVTNSTGGLTGLQGPYVDAYLTNSNSDVNAGSAQFSPNSFTSAGVNQRHGEVISMGNNPSSNLNAGTDNSSPWSVSVSANYNSKDSGESYWLDINGDGLLDRIVGGGTPSMQYYLNVGNKIDPNPQSFKNLQTYSSRPVGGAGLGLGFNLGSIANIGFTGSVGATVSLGTSEATFEDVNGDGLIDILNIGSNATYVKYNLGNKFSDAVEIFKRQNNVPNKVDFNNESKTYNGSVSIGGSYFYNWPIVWWPFPPFPLIYMKIGGGATANVGISIAEVDKTFKDMNGDGLPDLVISKNDGFVVNYSKVGRTNKLKTVINNITKGRFNIDYAYSKPNYDNPYSKLVMTEVRISNPDINSPDYSYLASDPNKSYTTKFEYEDGKYDRREREFFGFGKVYIKDMEGPNVYRTVKQTYHNRSYFLKGLLTRSETFAGPSNGVLMSKIENDYSLYKLSNNNSQLDLFTGLQLNFDTGGREGRKMAVALLSESRKTNYAAGNQSIETKSEYIYNNKEQLIQYNYISNDSSNNYTTIITYNTDPLLLARNILNVPENVKLMDASGNVVRERSSLVGSSGDLDRVSITLNSSETAVTDFEYDAMGNVVSVTYPENKAGERYSLSYTYDTDLQKYVTAVNDNSFGLYSYSTYDPMFDTLTESIDVNGNTTKYEYDSRGRLTSVLAPKEAADGLPYTSRYDYFMSPYTIPSGNYNVYLYGVNAQHYDQMNQGNDIETISLADFLGRVVQVKKDIEVNGEEKMSVSGMVVYDLHGRPFKKYHPTIEAKNPAVNKVIKLSLSNYYKTSEYDPLDRAVKSTDEDGRIAQSSYGITNGLYKTTLLQMQDANTQLKSEIFSSAEGRAVNTKQYLAATGQVLSSDFQYDITGNTLKVTDPEGITTKYTYDLAGRKITEEHPDRGFSKYQYDTAGNLIGYRSANLIAGPTGEDISYKYEYNRLVGINLPKLPNGDANPNNVIYKYGSQGSGNESGRLIAKIDGTGVTEYEHGSMGEIIQENRKVVGYNIPALGFLTRYKYDSWNRITSLVYPDGEVLKYSYNLGGNLNSIGNDNGYNYVKEIAYDGYEQRTFIRFGNGDTETYSYLPTNRNLNTYLLKDANANTLLNNNYSYDFAGNITYLNNTAGPSSNGMGNVYNNTYHYDQLNRLVDSSSAFGQPGTTPSSPYSVSNSGYNLDLKYNGSGGIVQKVLFHDQNNVTVPQNTYENNYEYLAGTHKLNQIFDSITGSYETFDYDSDGNVIKHVDENGAKRMYWDELDRMKAISDPNNGIYQYYVYDNKGDRTIKYMLSQETQLYQNGSLVDGNMVLDGYKIYPSPYVVVSSDDTYTKHYYIGGQRIASRLINGNGTTNKNSSLESFSKNSDKDQEVDPQIDFKNYLKKADIEIKDLQTEFKVNGAQTGLYYLHSDHLGTASYVTDENSVTTQFFLNLPYGETMAEQQLMYTYDNPYKFNAKELDVETGLYYYGARYYNPRLSIWYGVDPLTGALPTRSPYEYTFSNPVRYTDPTGMYPDGGPGGPGGPGDEKVHDIEEVIITGRKVKSWIHRNIIAPVAGWFTSGPDISQKKGSYVNFGSYREGEGKGGWAGLQAGFNDKRNLVGPISASTQSVVKVFNFEGENKSKFSMQEGYGLDVSVKAALASATTETYVGHERLGVFVEAEGDYGYAKAETSNGLFWGEKIGWSVGAGGEAGALKGEATYGINVDGLRIGFTEGGCFECAGASYKMGMYYDTKKGTLNINGVGGAAVEGGIKLGGRVTIPIGKWIRIVSKAKTSERN